MEKNTQNILIVVVLMISLFMGLFTYFHISSVNHLEDRIETLNSTYTSNIDYCQDSLRETRTNLSQRKYEVRNLLEIIEWKNKSIGKLKDKNLFLQNKLDEGNTFYTPTPGEVRKILEETEIDENNFVVGKYDCNDYSYDLVEEFRKRNIFSCTVSLHIQDSYGHAINAVNTTEGVLFIEPQSDTVMDNIKIGEDYCKKVGWSCKEKWTIKKIAHCYR